MLIGPRRAVLIGVIAAVAITIIMVPALFTLNAPNFDKISVRLSNVTITDQTDQSMDVNVAFTIDNPTDVTVTTSKVDYELFANGVSLGNNTLSYEDVPLNGRPAIFSHQTVPVTHTFAFKYSDNMADIFNKIKENPSAIKWRASGSAEIESTLTIATKDFDNEI